MVTHLVTEQVDPILGNFDDQFHPDLQHNRGGILSFAKSGDDTNNSQFFITEGPTRHLDFNHSIFGQLVEGEEVREAISEMDTNGPPENRPDVPVVISTIDVFKDTENAVVFLKALGNAIGFHQRDDSRVRHRRKLQRANRGGKHRTRYRQRAALLGALCSSE